MADQTNPIPEPILPETAENANVVMGPANATGPLARLARQRITNALLKKGYSQQEVDEAIQDAESDRPLLDLFMTYVFPILLKLIENLILAKRAAT